MRKKYFLSSVLGLLICTIIVLYLQQEDYLSQTLKQPDTLQPGFQNGDIRWIWELSQKSADINEFEIKFKEFVTQNKNPNNLQPTDQKWFSESVNIDTSQKGERTPTMYESSRLRDLTKELAWEHARENIVVVTWCNLHFVDFAINWARRLQHLGMTNYLVGAMDQGAAEILVQNNVNTFRMYEQHQNGSGLGEGDFGWGSQKFHQMGRQKIGLLLTFIEFGLDIFLCDVDTVMLSDPTDYFVNFPEADILTSSDHLASTIPKGDKGLELPEAAHSALNIGVMFFRHSQATVALIQEWVSRIEADDKLWDQEAFGQLIRQGWNLHLKRQDRLLSGFDGSVMLGVLPVTSFASGHTYFVQKLYQLMNVEAIVVHCTFQYGGVRGKRHRLREAGLWWEETEEYYQGGFVQIEMQTLQTNYTQQSNDWEVMDFHLTSIQHQLLQVKGLLAASVALNRSVILPKFECHCDRYWGPVEQCRIPGAFQTPIPYTCPLDHIMEPFHFDDDPTRFGPPISFREFSFLEHEQTPAELKESVLVIQPDIHIHEAQAQGNVLMVPLHQSDKELQQSLEPYKTQYRVFKFQSAHLLFGYFENQELDDKFTMRISHIPGFWCCRGPSWPHGKGGTPYAPLILNKGIRYDP